MKSKLPKVMHRLAGVPLVGHVLTASQELAPKYTLVVVGVGKEVTEGYLSDSWPGVKVVEQVEQKGTGHAVKQALAALAKLGEAAPDASVLVVSGDTPLITPAALNDLLKALSAHGAKAALLTAEVSDPTGYGRILRDNSGESVIGIVEEVDATEAQKAMREVNGGVYAFDLAALRKALGEVGSQNAAGEEYLTQTIGLISATGAKVLACQMNDADLVAGVNDRTQLAFVGAKLNSWITSSWMKSGVTIIDPATTWVEATVRLAPDTVIWPNTYLAGDTVVGEGSVIGPDVTLSNTVVGVGARVERSTVRDSKIGAGSSVGPYAHLRPGTVIDTSVHVGSFVEIKNSSLGVGAKVPHLTYVGDADIGEGTNIGASSVFVNYDGVTKHRTSVGKHVRVGSDTMLVAPVNIGDGAYTAAGSVITEDVPPGAMAVARERQRNIEGWVKRKRGGTEAARAADAAES
jgi:bifunctional UDP-N-acetylglucosamine pyrophosphorylase/glucosamine-1-phosphate N-acetyltransferase